MKKKDIVMLVVAVVILLAAGYIGYTQLSPKKGSGPKTVQVEKVGLIADGLDQDALTMLGDSNQVVDYDLPEDLSGLNNTAPFGQ